ncbi:MAG: M48 family metallopeptidase [Planctomycetia bacterium]|nr:M48 family metallopeptidase [Planctomycetia bacterium]
MAANVQGTTMNFFLRQDEARKKTGLLVFLFIVAVFLTFLAVHTLIAFAVMLSAGNTQQPDLLRHWLDPSLLMIDFFSVSLVVFGGSLFKIASLSSLQGDGIAQSLGGRLVDRDTKDPRERRLLNIVEEMALASGIHVPNVYVLDGEEHINAFAAGFTPNTSVVSVTSGALNYLSRDELQGVVAHEFSHIINEDTRISLRLMGILFGLEMLVLIGMLLVRALYYVRFTSDSDSDSDSKGAGTMIVIFLMLLGLGLIIIGWIGMFFSNIIRAAVSRQREFLADASAVQYTRNPDGIGGALKKIGSPAIGSQIDNSNAVGAGHLFIGSVLKPGFFSSMFDSHPDLTVRIQRIDPSFDGTFPETIDPIDPITGRSAIVNQQSTSQNAGASKNPFILQNTVFKGTNLPPIVVGTATAAAVVDASASNLDQLGTVDEKKLVIANELLQAIPEELSSAARGRQTACDTICAILMDTDSELGNTEIIPFENRLQKSPVLAAQWKILAKTFPQESLDRIRHYYEILQTLPSSIKIPIAEIAFPSLKEMEKTNYQTFRNALVELITADKKVDLFEYTLQQYLIRDLDRYYGFTKPEAVKYFKIREILPMYQNVLSYLAYAGNDDLEEVQKAFKDGCSELSITGPILPKEKCTSFAFGSALSELAKASPILKKQLLSSFYRCIASDGIITMKEGELIRAISATLDAPMPVWS